MAPARRRAPSACAAGKAIATRCARHRRGLPRAALVGIFPEGGLRHGGPIGELHRGAALIALRAGVPLIPVAIGRRPAFVRVGEPLAPDGDARTLTTQLAAALTALLAQSVR